VDKGSISCPGHVLVEELMDSVTNDKVFLEEIVNGIVENSRQGQGKKKGDKSRLKRGR